MKKIKRMLCASALLIVVGMASVSAMTVWGSYRVSGFDVRWGGIYTTGRGWTYPTSSGRNCGLSLVVGSAGIVDTGYGGVDRTYSTRGAWLNVSSSHWNW